MSSKPQDATMWPLSQRNAILADPFSPHSMASMPRWELPRWALLSTLTPLPNQTEADRVQKKGESPRKTQ